MKPVRVVVIDRNDITRKGVEGIVSDAGDPFQVTTTLVHVREVEPCLKEQAVEVLILDDQTVHPHEVMQLATTCHQQAPDTGLVVLSQRRNREYIQGVMRRGNASFILKNGDVQEQLLKALQLISGGYPFISPDAFKIMNSSSPPTLDSQDWDVLRLLGLDAVQVFRGTANTLIIPPPVETYTPTPMPMPAAGVELVGAPPTVQPTTTPSLSKF